MKWSINQYKAINEKDKSIVVSAGAGSGKTAVLTERIFKKITVDKVKLENLIVLTFGNAAALEMKMRVAKRLNNEENKSVEILEAIDYIEQSNITTFDAYSLKLVKKYNYLLDLDDDINIADSLILNRIKDEILDDLFEEKYKNNDFLKFIDKYVNKDDNQIKKAIKEIYSSFTYKLNMNDIFNNYETYFLSNDYKEKTFKKIIAKQDEIMEELDNELIILEGLCESEKAKKYALSFRNYIFSKGKENAPKLSTEKDVDPKEEIKEQKDKIKKMYDKVIDILLINEESFEKIISDTKNDQREIVKLMIDFDLLYKEKKKKMGLYDFSDIAKLSIELLENNELIREEIKNKTNEILIDEYQDTSDVQDYFISLISNNNTYYVGDIKQSIYGFRGANPSLFSKKCEENYKIDLIDNFRSRSNVLEGVNRIFNPIMSKKYGGCDFKDNHALNYGFKLYSDYNIEDYDPEIIRYNDDKCNIEKEAIMVAKDILDKIKNNYMVFDRSINEYRKCEYKDFCLLSENKSTYNTYKDVFKYFKIPLSIYKDEEFLASDEIYVLRSLISLCIKFNNHAAYSVLRSFLFEISNPKEEDLKNLNQRISKVVKNSCNLYLLLNNLLEEFLVFNKLTSLDNYELRRLKIYKLLEMSKTFSTIGLNVKYLNESFDYIINKLSDYKFDCKLPNDNACKIMTIHKSKGLEFPICYFIEVSKEFNFPDLRQNILFDDEYGLVLSLGEDIIEQNVLKQLIIEKRRANMISEKIRLFYVALTRAKEKIIIISKLSEKRIDNIKQANSFLDFIDLSLPRFKERIENVEIIDYLGLNNTSFNSLSDSKVNISNVEYKKQEITSSVSSHKLLEIIDEDTLNVLKIGTKFHKYLEIIDFFDYNSSIKELEISKQEVDILNKFFKLDILKDVKEVYKEHYYKVKTELNEHVGIIDLILEKENEIIIIDYKLSNTDKDYYVDQLRSYKDYLKTVFDKKISTYLYSIMKGELKLVTC